MGYRLLAVNQWSQHGQINIGCGRVRSQSIVPFFISKFHITHAQLGDCHLKEHFLEFLLS